MAPGQETNDDNLVKSFRSSIQYWYVAFFFFIESARRLMSTHNIQFHDKIRKYL